jgi:hypothetical protein
MIFHLDAVSNADNPKIDNNYRTAAVEKPTKIC